MNVNVHVSERAFEEAIEAALLQTRRHGRRGARDSFDVIPPGGYSKRDSEDYDKDPLPYLDVT